MRSDDETVRADRGENHDDGDECGRAVDPEKHSIGHDESPLFRVSYLPSSPLPPNQGATV